MLKLLHPRNHCKILLNPFLKRFESSNQKAHINEFLKSFNQLTETGKKALTQDGSLFQKIIDRQITIKELHSDDKCIVINELIPVAPVHLVVIPKRKITRIEFMNDDDVQLIGHLLKIASKFGKQRAPNGFRLVINNGKDGAQSVNYLHVHILGGRQLLWPPG